MTTVPIVYRSTDNAKWGAGKDSKLTIDEGDGNLWELVKAVQDLTDNPPTAVSIANIMVIGTSMQISLTDGTTLGPFKLPVASFRYRKEGYIDGADYAALDLIPVLGQGLFLVMNAFTASGAFDPNASDGTGDDLFVLLFGEDTYIYDFSFSYPGKPGGGVAIGDDIAEHMFLRDVYFPVDFVNSLAKLSVAPAADLVYDITKEGATIGTLTFSAGTVAGVFAATDPVQFGNGDTLGLKKLTATDTTANGLRIGFAGVRGLVPTT